MFSRKTSFIRFACLIGLSCATVQNAAAQSGKISDDVVRIGVLTDMTSLYSDFAGPGSAEAVRMAVEDFGGKVAGKPIDVVVADHQNKPDIATAIARRWFDTNQVDVIVDLVSSGVSLAVSEVGRDKHRPIIVTAGYSGALINESCSPYTIHYQVDTGALSNTPRTLVSQGASSWFFVTADYVFGQTMQRDATEAIVSAGGKVLGSVRHPLNVPDFSSYLLQAQNSGAKFVGLANAGGDTVASIKAAKEFGLTNKQSIVAMVFLLTDIHAIGLDIAQGLYTTASFYWDRDEKSRTWSERFYKRTGKMPTEIHAANYSAVLHYLQSVADLGSDNADAVLAKFRENPVNDLFATNGLIRADGQLIKDLYLVQVKSPSESKRPWDYLKLLARIPGDQAFVPLSKSRCPLLKKQQ